MNGIELLEHKWSAQILLSLEARPLNFNSMLHGIDGISDRVLTERLRLLESRQLIKREVLVGPPVRVSYGLTVAGREFLTPLRELKAIDPDRQEVAQAS